MGSHPYAGTGWFKHKMGSTKLNAISYAISKVENGVAERNSGSASATTHNLK